MSSDLVFIFGMVAVISNLCCPGDDPRDPPRTGGLSVPLLGDSLTWRYGPLADHIALPRDAGKTSRAEPGMTPGPGRGYASLGAGAGASLRGLGT